VLLIDFSFAVLGIEPRGFCMLLSTIPLSYIPSSANVLSMRDIIVEGME
jgi:hypothetical protein